MAHGLLEGEAGARRDLEVEMAEAVRPGFSFAYKLGVMACSTILG
jgi:hypothetical protein